MLYTIRVTQQFICNERVTGYLAQDLTLLDDIDGAGTFELGHVAELIESLDYVGCQLIDCQIAVA